MRNSAKSTGEKIYISFHLKISHSSVHFTDMRKIFRRNGNLSQTLKPIIIERATYCIQFEIVTETVKFLKFNKMSHASEQIIITFRNGENSRVEELGNLEKNWLCLSHLREKSTGFHMIQMKNILMKLWIWDTEIVFIC